jgi:hypothetical protein
MPPAPPVSKVEALRRTTRLLFGRPTHDVAKLAPARLTKCGEAELRAAAQLLNLADADIAPKANLVARLSQVLARLVADAQPAEAAELTPAAEPSATDLRGESEQGARSRFDLGPMGAEQAPRHIPWSYGQDRVTAMVVNPHTLYLYWEITDEAIDHGRRWLGPAGRDAWLNLRVYDVSGRIFDGTNALSYLDYRVDRADRQWFVEVGRPGSTAIVELGMKSSEGHFVKLARSGRADFPRHAPAAAGAVEWLTVRDAVGDVEPPVVTAPPGRASREGSAGPHGRPMKALHALDADGIEPGWDWHELIARLWSETHEVIRRDWVEAGRTFEWVGPLVRTSWEAGPFPIPVDVPQPSSERYEGPAAVYTVDGKTRVVFGPWQVVIRGLSGWADKRVLARWDVYSSWLVGEGFVSELRRQQIEPRALTLGGSEVMFEGASELRWLFGSELRLAGASEVFLLGASELRLLGASETLLAGASEYRYRGASEVLAAGGSEYRYAGASEQIVGGASESLWRGASENLGGASEMSERRPEI